jgi:hypothetical protein
MDKHFAIYSILTAGSRRHRAGAGIRGRPAVADRQIDGNLHAMPMVK